RAVQTALSTHEFARLAGSLARAGRLEALVHDRLGDRRILLEERGETLTDHLLDEALHLVVSELDLRLPLELRLRNAQIDHRRESFTGVFPLNSLAAVLYQPVARRVVVQRAGQRGAEPGQV